jgi:SAM-dependent methyltransferase
VPAAAVVTGVLGYRDGMGFEWAYRSGDPPWDIGAPQPAIVRLAEQGVIRGEIIDVGCGTGDNVLYLAARGLAVVGVDAAPTAISRAEEKARGEDSRATFLVADALALDRLARTFDTAIDCGLFHTFGEPDRLRFERSLHATLRPGSRYVLLCFNEHQPGVMGPNRVTQAEIRATFATGWAVDSIVAERFAARVPGGGAHAWLALLTRI